MNNYLSPLDNRYYDQIKQLDNYFSEKAFFKYRIQAEIEYLIFFLKTAKGIKIPDSIKAEIRQICVKFNDQDYLHIKEIEKTTRHDVKAIEYFLREKLSGSKIDAYLPFIHLGITSEDTNNIAYALIFKDYLHSEYLPTLKLITDKLNGFSTNHAKLVMCARTHGQKAVPTTMGKEFYVFVYRLKKLSGYLKDYTPDAKINGAVGNFNALFYLFPRIDWPAKTGEFIKSLGLNNNPVTTQIESSDSLYELFSAVKHVNLIFIGLVQDIWRYISDDYLILQKNEQETGSSTMPQKINPIMFENAEGNLKLANSLCTLFTDNLVISRLQRDLSDSTLKRNFGVIFGHTQLAYQMILSGFEKITPNIDRINADLNSDYSILAEAIQISLRNNGYNNGYEMTKKITRGNHLTQNEYKTLVKEMKIDNNLKSKLSKLNPEDYIGLADKLVTV